MTAGVSQDALYQRKEQLLGVLLEALPLCVWAIDPKGIVTVHEGKDPAVGRSSPEQAVGRSIFELYPDMTLQIHQALAGERVRWAGERHGAYGETWVVPVRDERGDVTQVLGVTLDVSKHKHIEQYLRLQLKLVRRQKQAIRELSVPIIEVWNKVLTLPMLGVVDSARAAEVMGSLLEAVVRTRARFAILDLTGVEAVDVRTAAHLVDLVRAVQLLGAEGIVTGIRPNVAQTIVALGLDLRSITTLSNLRAGLRYCITHMSHEKDAGKAAELPSPAR